VATRDELVPPGTPDAVAQRAALPARAPVTDPALGIDVAVDRRGEPQHRLVAIGDSLTQGFQSGAVFLTDLSYAAVVAAELGWGDSFRYPRYPGHGGLPFNIELLARDLEQHYGATLSPWEVPLALFRARQLMDETEDYWERGPGSVAPDVAVFNHALAVYSWDLRDVLSRTAANLQARIEPPRDDLALQLVSNHIERAALRVYPHWSADTRQLTLLQVAQALGGQHDEDTDAGIETLVVCLGANNALKTITKLSVVWSDDDFRDLQGKERYTVWRPEHFAAELAEVVAAVRRVEARHVIWCTVPHITIAPLARGVDGKVGHGSRYFPYYTRPWISDDDFDPGRDKHITAAQARAVDAVIDIYNDTLQDAVADARRGVDGTPRDWYLLDLAGLLDRLATRRYIADPGARPDWWTPYPLPPALQAFAAPAELALHHRGRSRWPRDRRAVLAGRRAPDDRGVRDPRAGAGRRHAPGRRRVPHAGRHASTRPRARRLRPAGAARSAHPAASAERQVRPGAAGLGGRHPGRPLEGPVALGREPTPSGRSAWFAARASSSAIASCSSPGRVTLRLAGSPGSVHTVTPDACTRVVSSTKVSGPCGSSSAYTSRSRDRRAPCGVCDRKSPCRSRIPTTLPSTNRRMLSGTATTGTAAPCSRAPHATRSIRSGVTSGRAPSWIRTTSASEARTPAATESWRRAPPATTVASTSRRYGARDSAATRSG